MKLLDTALNIDGMKLLRLDHCFVEIVTTLQSIDELNYFPNCDTLQARQPFGNYSVLLYLYFTVIIFLIRLLCVTYRFRTTLTKNKQQFETHGFGCVSQQNNHKGRKGGGCALYFAEHLHAIHHKDLFIEGLKRFGYKSKLLAPWPYFLSFTEHLTTTFSLNASTRHLKKPGWDLKRFFYSATLTVTFLFNVIQITSCTETQSNCGLSLSRLICIIWFRRPQDQQFYHAHC